MQKRRMILRLLAVSPMLAAAGHASAETAWPAAKPIRLVVPTAPGGGTDIFARVIAEHLGKALKQPIVVENKSGANGMIGQDAVVRAHADGYTLLFTYTAAVAVNPAIQPKMSYDTLKDLKPVVQIGAGGNYLVVTSDVPARDLKSFVAWAKANPGKYSYGSWGVGSGGHLTMEALKMQTGIQLSHVPYRGTSPIHIDMQAGTIKVAFVDTVSSLPYLKTGKIRALAVSGSNRAPLTPDIPTMTEQGYPFDTDSWYGLFAPANTPDAIVRRLNAEVNRLMASPEMKERFGQMNMAQAPAKTPDEFARTVRDDVKAWGEIARTNNIKVE